MDKLQFSSFPPEIIEHILKFVDGPTMIEAELVCKEWRSIIEYLDEKYNIWSKFYNDISKKECYAINQKCRYTETEKIWNIIIHNWISWQKLTCRNYCLLQISTDINLEYITCVKISGNIIITGNMTGHLNFISKQKLLDSYYTSYNSYIDDLHCLNAIPYEGSGFQHTHLLFVCKSVLVFLKLGTDISEVSNKTEVSLYSVFKDYLCFADYTGQVFVERMVYCTDGSIEFMKLSYSRIYPPVNIKSLCIYSDTVTLVTDYSTMTIEYNKAPMTRATIGQLLSHPAVEQYWSFYNEIIFATANCNLYYTPINTEYTERSKSINCMEVLGSTVCNLYLHGNVLIIAMESGMVYLYYVKTWQDFHPENYDVKIQAASESVCGIDIQELSVGQKLILCTNTKIVEVFFSK